MKGLNQKKIGFTSMILLGINSIIGTGIFLLPGQVTALAGRWSLLSYLFVVLLVIAIVWCFAKCASQFSRNGGSYLYAKEAFGNFIGFEIGLLRWVVGTITWAVLAVGFATALEALFPSTFQETSKTLIALMIVNGLSIFNIFGVQALTHLNNLATIAKILPLIFFILLGFTSINQMHLFNFDQKAWEVETFSAASMIVFFAFSGFENLPVVAAEMKNPRKHIPIAVFIVVIVCACLYFLIQLIAMGILGEALSSSKTPILDAAEKMLGDPGKLFVGIAMLISIGGINIAASFITPRSGVALAEDTLMPSSVAYRNRFDSPFVAIILTMVATNFFVFFGNFTQLIAISIVCRFIQYISTCLALFFFHFRGHFLVFDKAWKIIFPLFALTGIIWLLFQAAFWQIAMGFSVLLLGVPFYFIRQSSMTHSSFVLENLD